MPELDQLFDQVRAFGRPPLDRWLPERTVDFDLRIAANGDWYHEGRMITRHNLVKLFSTVLALRDGDFYLITPAVRYRIIVEDVPFLAVEMTRQERPEIAIAMRTNMDEVVVLDAEHPLDLRIDPVSETPSPVISVRDGLLARLTRSVFYQLVTLAEPVPGDEELQGIFSCGTTFLLR